MARPPLPAPLPPGNVSSGGRGGGLGTLVVHSELPVVHELKIMVVDQNVFDISVRTTSSS
jgi:hypothetical protein